VQLILFVCLAPERLQMSHNVRVSPAATPAVRRKLQKVHGQLFRRIPPWLHALPEAAVRHEARERQRRLPAVHQREGPHPHERHQVVDIGRLCSALGPHRCVPCRADREGLVYYVY